MKVSLWGPHSFETSTFDPKVVEVVEPGAASGPKFFMNSYLLHQVGSCEVFAAEAVGGGAEMETKSDTTANAKSSESLKVSFIAISFGCEDNGAGS